MALSFEDFVRIISAELTPEEFENGVVYAADSLISAGTTLPFPGTSIDVTTDSRLAFIDRDPMANWGHSSRYLLVNVDDGALVSMESRRPPFQDGGGVCWRMIYQAPSVPNAAVALPQQTR